MIKYSMIQAAAVCLLALEAGTAHAVPAFVNPSFEADAWAVGDNFQSSPSDWTTVQSSDLRFVDGVRNTGNTSFEYTPFGEQFVILCAADCEGGTFGSISQTLSGFEKGARYRLNFEQSPEVDSQGGQWDALVEVVIAGSGTTSATFSAIAAGLPTHVWADWQAQSMEFVADATSLTFTFSGAITHPCCSFPGELESGIDSFSLTQLSRVPEPAAMALVGLGLFVLGWSRRKQA